MSIFVFQAHRESVNIFLLALTYSNLIQVQYLGCWKIMVRSTKSKFLSVTRGSFSHCFYFYCDRAYDLSRL